MSASSFQSLLQLFFADRLRAQLGASPHTIAAYRDTFRLLLQFALPGAFADALDNMPVTIARGEIHARINRGRIFGEFRID